MTDIKQTAIYKSLSKAVRKEDHAELERILDMARTAGGCAFVEDETNLCYAFTWFRTPQGAEYWETLCRRLLSAGWRDQA